MTMTTETLPRPITEAEYIQLEASYLGRRLAEGDLENVATSVATLRQALHLLDLMLTARGIDMDGVCGRIAQSQGEYRHWPVLDE